MKYSDENLQKILKAALKAVKNSGITEPELRTIALKFALNYQFQTIQGDKKK